MSRWHVEGAHLETGDKVSQTIDAKDYADLQVKLRGLKIVVEKAKELKPAQVTPPATSKPMTALPSSKTYTVLLVLVALFAAGAVGTGMMAVGEKMSGNEVGAMVNQVTSAISFFAAGVLYLLREIAIHTQPK